MSIGTGIADREQGLVEIRLLRSIEQLAYNVVEGEGKIAEARQQASGTIAKRTVLTEITHEEGRHQLNQLQGIITAQLLSYAERANQFTPQTSATEKQAKAFELFNGMQEHIPVFPQFLEKEALVDLYHLVLTHDEFRARLDEAKANGDISLSVEIIIRDQPLPEAQANLRYDQFLLKGQLTQLITHREPELENLEHLLNQRVKEEYIKLVQEQIPQKYHFHSHFMQAESRAAF